jgi:PAS domain S-box-containing protein
VRRNFRDLWLEERLGLTMIVSSITVIAVTVLLLTNFQIGERLEQLRQQGASISNILADVPFPELRARGEEYGPLRLLQLRQDDEDFAYALIVDQSGRILNAVNSPAVEVNEMASDASPGAWSGERELNLPNSGRKVIEFFSPVVDGNKVMGMVRVGYFVPGFKFDAGQLPFLGSLALIIFLLTPLFYFAVRREIRPMKAVNEEISTRLSEGQFNSCTVEASGELKEFIDRFNKFTDLARSRIEVLEQNNNELVASQKLLGYRKLRIEAVLKAIPEAIMILGEDGSVTYANEMVKELLGVEPADIMHRKPSEWCVNPDALEFLSRFETSTTANYYSETARFTSPMATQKKLSIKAYPLFSPKDPESIFGRLVVLRDVTKDALAEDGRSDFVAHVSHELKTPLNTLALYAEALQGEQGRDDSFRIEAYNVINDEVERLAALVDNLLSITKIEMGNLKVEKQRTRLQELLRDAFQHVSQSDRAKNQSFKINVPPELSTVAVDKDLLRIAINNLLVNAIKYTPAGGQIMLSAVETDSSIEIRVTDNGIGIAAEDQDKIFDKFYRVGSEEVREIGGHGLGLPLAKEIIELHRGQLSVRSEPGKGSEFVISFWKDSGLLKQAI